MKNKYVGFALMVASLSTAASVASAAEPNGGQKIRGCADPVMLSARFDSLDDAYRFCSTYTSSLDSIRVVYDYYYHQYVCHCDNTSSGSGGNR